MKKRASALVMAGLISVQTLAPTVTSFANEIKLNTEEINNNTNSNARSEQYAYIPDAKLKAELNRYVAKMTGKTRNPNDPILISDINKLSGNIDMRSKGIKDITGLEHLKNVYEITLAGNEIQDISPLAKLQSNKLNAIFLNGNQIKSIEPIVQMNAPNLDFLRINDNQIEDIKSLANWKVKLRKLYLDQNRIQDISSLANMDMSELTHLSIYKNQIKDISSLANINLPKLIDLNLENNQISDISPLAKIKAPNLKNLYLQYQNIRGKDVTTHSDSAVVDNIVIGIDGKKVEPQTDGVYTIYNKEKEQITFERTTSSGNRSYNFATSYTLTKENGQKVNGIFSGNVTHNIEVVPPEVVPPEEKPPVVEPPVEKPEEKPPVVEPPVEKPEEKPPVVKPEENPIKAGLNKENGGIMLSSDGAGLRFFTKLENVSSEEVATYYVTTASNSSETPKFEVKSTVLKGDYSQLKTTIEFNDLSKLNNNEDTKLYVKRVVKGKEDTYTEIKTGNVDLSKPLEIESKDMLITVTIDENGSIKLNKKASTSVFEQGVSKIDWNLKGMVVEGSPTNNGTNTEFNNAKVSMVFKDAKGEYVKEEGTSNILEVRGSYIDGKYKITIPYENLTNVKTFELRLIGSNIQISDVLKQGSVTNFRTGLNEKKKVFKLSAGDDKIVKLTIEDLGNANSQLTSAKETIIKETNIRQFSITGDINLNGIDIIPSDVKCSIIAKKGEETLFEQALTKTKKTTTGFKTNLKVSEFVNKLSPSDKVSFTIKVEYLGQVIETDLLSNQVSVSITDDNSKQTFEMKSENGKVIVVKK